MGNSHRNELVSQWPSHRQTLRTLHGKNQRNPERRRKNEFTDGH